MYPIKCPECNASLEYEEGIKVLFCRYCGAKVLIENENEHIYRHIDEAEIKHEETERMVRMRELDMEEKARSLDLKFIIGTVAACAILLVLSFIGDAFNIFVLQNCYFLAVVVGIIGFIHYKDKMNFKVNAVNNSAGNIQPALSAEQYIGKDRHFVVKNLKDCGFKDVRAIPLGDLTIGVIEKPDKVESITIGGKSSFKASRWFSPSDPVVIRYHSFQ